MKRFFGKVSDIPLVDRIAASSPVDFRRGVCGIPLVRRINAKDENLNKELNAVYITLWHSMKRRAGANESMTRDEFYSIVNRADGKCEFSGIEFNLDRWGKSKRRPFSPSVDRIDPSKGYSKENCRLVCTCVNLALNEWGDELLVMLARIINERKSFSENSGNFLVKVKRRA